MNQEASEVFLADGLRPTELKNACGPAGIKLRLRMQEGCGHSCFFMSTFMDDHLRCHAGKLAK